MAIEPGMTHTCETVVNESNVAKNVGSGSVDVFSTPMMILLIEQAASACIQPQLGAGQASVGTYVDVSHKAATPMGMRVSATATVTAVDGRQVTFKVQASDEAGLIGKGTHIRFIIDEERFVAKTNAKLS